MKAISIKRFNWQLLSVIITGIGILLFLCQKAMNASFTHDESYTYLRFVHQNFMDILSYRVAFTNNHILNTLLVKYFEELFGSSEFVLRLPNILAFVVYSFFSVRLFNKKAPALLLPFYLLMIGNPYMLEFFALCRGYGLSFAFMMMSLYYLICYFDTKQSKHLILFNLGAFLAFMSNFSLLNYYVAALITYNIVMMLECRLRQNTKFSFYQSNKINLIAIAISATVLYEPLRKISGKNMLDFGGKTGFMRDTIGSLVNRFFYEMPTNELLQTFFQWISVTAIILIFAILVFMLLRKQKVFFEENISLMILNLILLGITTITLLQHYVIGNDFYTERFALFLYPLFILNICLGLKTLYLKYNRPVLFGVSMLLGIVLLMGVIKNSNILFYIDWKYDCDTKLVMQKLKEEHNSEKNRKQKTQLGVNWLFEPSTNFYRYTWDLNWLYPTHRNGINYRENYFYIFQNDTSFSILSKENVLLTNELSGSILAKKNH